MDNRAIILIGIVAICAFLGGILVGGPGDGEESEAVTSPPAPPEEGTPKALFLPENASQEENDSLSDMFSDPNGVEPPSPPSP